MSTNEHILLEKDARDLTASLCAVKPFTDRERDYFALPTSISRAEHRQPETEVNGKMDGR
jgi:hypothetical protein